MSPPAPLQRPALLALGCCLLAVFAAGVAPGALPGSDGAPAPEIVDDVNSTNYLQPPGDDVREGSAVQGVDVSVAAAADADTLEGALGRATFDERLAAAESQADRIDRINGMIDNLSDRTDRIRSTARSNRASYRSGSLSEAAFFARMARLEVATERAGRYQEQLRLHLEGMGARSEPVYLGVQGLQPDIDTLSGPVTDRLLARYAGNASANSTYVRVTEEGGYVMATVSGDRFYREAQVGADWNRAGTDQFANEEVGSFVGARSRAADLYPWAVSHQVRGTNLLGYPSTTTLYNVVYGHQHGQLSIYLDATTTDVFREEQTKHLEAIPWNWRRSTTAGDLRMNVSGTNPTGALEVEVTRPDTQVGVDSEVRINGTYVGDTGPDGRLWTVQPPGSLSVNATSGDGNVTLAVSR